LWICPGVQELNHGVEKDFNLFLVDVLVSKKKKKYINIFASYVCDLGIDRSANWQKKSCPWSRAINILL